MMACDHAVADIDSIVVGAEMSKRKHIVRVDGEPVPFTPAPFEHLLRLIYCQRNGPLGLANSRDLEVDPEHFRKAISRVREPFRRFRTGLGDALVQLVGFGYYCLRLAPERTRVCKSLEHLRGCILPSRLVDDLLKSQAKLDRSD